MQQLVGDGSDGRGCTGMMFLPGSGDTEMLCCRTAVDSSGMASSFLSVVDINGTVLTKEAPFGEAGTKYDTAFALCFHCLWD